jgi:hypothetical protein
LNFAGLAAVSIESSLMAADIETRRWWGDGAHAHPATESLQRAAIPNTEILAKSTLSVPFFRGLAIGDIGRVAEHVLGAVA